MADDDWKGEHLIRRRIAHDERTTLNPGLASKWALFVKQRKGVTPPREAPRKRRKAQEAAE